jgi:hypothetical protein
MKIYYFTVATITSTLSSGCSSVAAFSVVGSSRNVSSIRTIKGKSINSATTTYTYPSSTSYSTGTCFQHKVTNGNGIHSNPRTPVLNRLEKDRTKSCSTRLFFSQRNNNDNNEDKSIFKKAADSIKNLVPSFLKPKSSQITQKQKTKEQVSSSIETMLKDAPLGIRMMGKMISPLISSAASNFAEAMEEQNRQISDILDDARMFIVSDKSATQVLGEPIEVGMPFSQSSSTTSINGKTRSSINASFEVRGNRGAGIATIEASNGNIDQMVLNVNGRNIYVDVRGTATGRSTKTIIDIDTDTGTRTTTSSKRTSGLGKNRVIKDDDIIDAEFVEKKFDK